MEPNRKTDQRSKEDSFKTTTVADEMRYSPRATPVQSSSGSVRFFFQLGNSGDTMYLLLLSAVSCIAVDCQSTAGAFLIA